MARMLSKSVLLRGSILHRRSSFLRQFSSKGELFEIELDSSSSPASAINKMEEIIHRIIVQKSTPDWLPFLPGSSFWVPLPCHGSKRVSDFVEQLTNQLTPEEYLSLTTDRGWPCSYFFALGNLLLLFFFILFYGFEEMGVEEIFSLESSFWDLGCRW
ncbi:hypothetical protein DITRI_Ditri10aG0187900 [Diplodiscus trichospermus]